MRVLGINCVYHESSACLLADGDIVAAAEEERFNRVKHGKQARADNPDELPVAAIEFCLAAAGIGPGDVEHVACAGDLETMVEVYERELPSPWSDRDDEALFVKTLSNIPRRLRELGFNGEFHWVPHHTAHAASAYFVSPFSDAAVLAVDALGDNTYSTRAYQGRGNALDLVQDVHFPASLGYLWESISVYLGFGVYDAAKVMGLAGYGDPERFSAALDQLVWPTHDGGFEMADDLLRFAQIRYYPDTGGPSAFYDGLVETFGIPPRKPSEPLLAVHHDIAAALQRKTDALVLHLARHLHERTGSSSLCIAGGVALNCVTNAHVFADGPYERLWIQPASNDGGLSVGAALHAWNALLGGRRSRPMKHAYWGPSFSDDAIVETLDRRGLRFHRVNDFERTVAELVAAEHIVGLFQGAMELGPRALGNRSIIADPRRAEMRDILNQKIKHREYFRPLAPSVLAEEASEWFEIGKETAADEYMLMAYRARPDKRDLIRAVVHVDGTSRIQAVRREANPRFHRIIEEFRSITGIPLVLNTSFNDQEPIICTPDDAIATFLGTDMDYLAIGSFLVAHSDQRPGVMRSRRSGVA